MSRRSGSTSGRWRRSRACGSEPRRGNPDTRTYRCLTHRATSRLYSLTDSKAAGAVLTTKQAPHRPGIAPALGLRAGMFAALIVPRRPTAEGNSVHRGG
jgi:hypothetical protein